MLDPLRFRKANPDQAYGKPCVCVGMTGLAPDLRFDKHMAGIQAKRFVTRYGQRLLPQLYAVYNPMPYGAACEMEVELAIGLREAGYGGLRRVAGLKASLKTAQRRRMARRGQTSP